MISRADRRAAGKALREKVTRRSHAGWKPPENRLDPIDLLKESSEGRIPKLLPVRYGRMMQSPFAFYRGAAAIMASDLARTPTTKVRVQACGDCHLMNFGGFATSERRLTFDINNFDETLPAPWEWDVKRLAASFVIAGRHNGFGRADARDVAERSVRSYREHMAEYAELTMLERWYEQLDASRLLGAVKSKRLRKRLVRVVDKTSLRAAVEVAFPKVARVRHGRVLIRDNPPLICHQSAFKEKAFDYLVREAFRRYRATLTDDRKVLLHSFEMQDMAVMVVGVGSVGTRCGILLMMGDEDDEPLFLQVKEASSSVLEPYAGRSHFANHGERVVVGQALMQAASDVFLGWTEVRGRHFYIRQLRDVRISPVPEALNPAAMKRYADWCGWALARAHAKSGGAATISGYLGTTARFDEAVTRFAFEYADQNERDHQGLLKAIRAGRIDVYRE
jgi:uncharacterized protein (DUF2252 family)